MGGFAGLQQALAGPAEAVIEAITAAGLVGRGGAAFPAGIKWQGTAQAPGEPKYIVVNADESELGTFKDRVLLEYDPYSLLEGMLIAAYAVGASRGYIYVRGEYQHAQAVLAEAVANFRQAGYLGEPAAETGIRFDVEIRSGAGAYICGEETALFESIEGKRGFPRIKPPFPTTNGLFDKPTVINNVETLCNVPLILREGVANYRQLGTEHSPGPKLFCLSGDVQHTGLVEAPFGLTLRELLDRFGGGPQPGRRIQAVLVGGAAGVFVHPDDLDIRLTFEDTRAAGLSIGSGAVMVFDDRRDLRQVLVNIAHFFAHESCGKCYPCQLGTRRQLEILERQANSEGLRGDWERLQDVGWTMTDASLCGLGQTAALAVLSAMKKWPELIQDPH
jgi:NADH-quinone oxidoreductase subunit F